MRADVLGLLGEPTESFARADYDGMTPTEAFRFAGSQIFDFGEEAFARVDVYVHPTRPRPRYHFAYDDAGVLQPGARRHCRLLALGSRTRREREHATARSQRLKPAGRCTSADSEYFQ